MKSIKLKLIQIFSNGSLSFFYKYHSDFSQVIFYEKDSKNFYFNKKKSTLKFQPESASSYKKKYLI